MDMRLKFGLLLVPLTLSLLHHPSFYNVLNKLPLTLCPAPCEEEDHAGLLRVPRAIHRVCGSAYLLVSPFLTCLSVVFSSPEEAAVSRLWAPSSPGQLLCTRDRHVVSGTQTGAETGKHLSVVTYLTGCHGDAWRQVPG